MTWNPASLVRRIRDVPEHLGELAGHLRDLAHRVRDAVAEQVGSTVSLIVHDTLQKLWKQPEPSAPERAGPLVSFPEGADWTEEDLQWAFREMPPEVLESLRLPAPSRASRPPTSSQSEPNQAETLARAGLLALALRSAGWWLQRRGSLLGALGAGLVVAAVGAIGGPLALSCLGLAEAATELIALNGVMTRWQSVPPRT